MKMQLSFKLNFDTLSISLITTSSTGLTIYLQLDFVLHDVPLPDVVVGGGADDGVVVVGRLGVVQQQGLREVVMRSGIDNLQQRRLVRNLSFNLWLQRETSALCLIKSCFHYLQIYS